MPAAVFILIAYLIGSLSFAVMVSRAFGLPDPRTYGSGNPGATNVLRTGRMLAALLTLAGDAGKGWLAVYLAQRFAAAYGVDATGVAACAVAVFFGHLFPVFFRFKGGKGVSTASRIPPAVDTPLPRLRPGSSSRSCSAIRRLQRSSRRCLRRFTRFSCPCSGSSWDRCCPPCSSCRRCLSGAIKAISSIWSRDGKEGSAKSGTEEQTSSSWLERGQVPARPDCKSTRLAQVLNPRSSIQTQGARQSDHRAVVGAEFHGRVEHAESVARRSGVEQRAQAQVGADASRHDQPL